jgi:signal transduction histidine kinase
LGLAIAREIIVEHRGKIECITRLSEGAEFRLTLPIIKSTTHTQTHVEVRMDAA